MSFEGIIYLLRGVPAALAVTACVGLAGAPFLIWWRARCSWVVCLPLGVVLFGLALHSISLTGLWRPAALWTSLAVGALVGALVWIRSGKRVPGRARGGTPGSVPVAVGRWTKAGLALLVLASAVPACRILLRLLSPDMQEDVWMYHLAAPELALKQGRLSYVDVLPEFLYPNLMENLYVYALIGAGDLWPRTLNLLLLLSGAALLVPTIGKLGWTAALFVLCAAVASPISEILLATGKADAGGLGLCFAGLAMVSGRSSGAAIRLLGWVLLGAAVASKYTLAVFLVPAWVLFARRGLVALAALLPFAVPAVWGAQNVLLTRDPVFPYWSLSGMPFFTAFGWGEMNRQAFQLELAMVTQGRSHWWADGLKILWEHASALLLLLPLCLVRPPREAVRLLVCGLGAIFLIMVMDPADVAGMARFLFPGVLVALFAVSTVVLQRAPALAGAALTVVAAVHAFQFEPARWPSDASLTLGFVTGRVTHEEFMGRSLRSYWELKESVRGTIGRGDGVIHVGGTLSLGLPGRPRMDRHWGATPVIWKIVSSSSDTDGIGKKMRQKNVKWIVHNIVTSALVGQCQQPFTWSSDMIGRYREYAERHLVPVDSPQMVDSVFGGHQIYRVTTTAGREPVRGTVGLPGIESVFAIGQDLVARDRYGEAEKQYRHLRPLLGDVAGLKVRLAYSLRRQGKFKEAHELYSEVAQAGLVEEDLYISLAVCASGLERHVEAKALAERSLHLYRDRQEEARWLIGRSDRALGR